VLPGRDIAGVVKIFQGVASGPLQISDRMGWSGYSVADEVMTILSTSGTTGQPKLVPLSIDNWRAAVVASAHHLGHNEDDTWLIAMPLHHVGGLSVLFRSAFVGGGVHLLPRFDALSFADALSGDVTMASVVPTMLRRILDLDTRRYAGLKAVLVGGGPIPEGLLEDAADRGLPVLPTYGMTETCAQVATLKPESALQYKADLLPGVEAIIDPSGRIALRGAQVFDGYVGGPSRGTDEWFLTGDFGVLEGGALRILGRADDVIVTGGKNVDPSLVEEVVARVPGVVGVMVVGVASEEWGNEVVCLYQGSARPSMLDDWARETLEPHQIPKRWVCVDLIPVTDVGKPDRNRGREIVSDQAG
jgi:O-succinylbenzoic acid--CoA ligase